MRRLAQVVLLLGALGLVLRPAPVDAAEGHLVLPAPAARTRNLPGVGLAHELTLATGLAFSPLLGVSAVGAFQYLKAPSAARSRLPWYDSPWLWIPGLLLSLMLIAKNVLPKGMKLPVDAAEFVGHKASAVLLAAPVLVPTAMAVITPTHASKVPVAAASLLPALGRAGSVAATLTVFFVVFVVSQGVNALVLLSPSSMVDNVLKAMKGAVLGALVVASLIHPLLGFAFACAILVVCLFVFGWAWRLMVWGTVTALDLLTFAHRRLEVRRARIRAFAFGSPAGAPHLTYGWLTVEDAASLTFTWRAWPLFRRKEATVAAAPIGLERGILVPTVLGRSGEARRTLFWLPPRYRGHEASLAEIAGLGPPLDSPLVRGFRGAWRCVARLWRRAPAAAAEAPADAAPAR